MKQPHCPHCRSQSLGGVSAAGRQPRAGDFTVCLRCATVLRFIDGAGGLGLAAVTDEEQAAACAQSPMNFLALTLLRRLVERQRARRRAWTTGRENMKQPHCPHCRSQSLGGVSAAGRQPRAGDFTVCLRCATVLRFIDGAGGLGLAAVTDEEQAAACAQSPMNFLALTLLRRLVERQRARRWAANNSRPGGSMPIEDFSLPLQACPRCRGALNITRAFGQVPDRPPRPGDYTVCFHCAAFLRVTGEGRRALVDQQELVRLAADDPDLVEQLLLVSTLVMRADQEARRQVLAEWAAAERAAKN